MAFSKNTIALAGVCLASLMFGLEISSVPVILPTLEKILHGGFKEMQWIMNAYTIACTTVLMATGTLADKFGRKRIFIISIASFGATSLVCGLAQRMPVLITARFLQGMSGGAILICLVAVLSHQFREGKERAKAFSAWGVIFGIGLGFGPIIGSMIVAVFNWQWVFLIHTLIAAVTLLLVIAGIKESYDPDAKKLDIAGIVTLSLAVFGLTYFITQGNSIGFTSTSGVLIITGTILCFILFVVAEKFMPYPMFDFSVFRIRNFSGAILGSMGMNFSFWPMMIYLPIYFQSALGYNSVNTGLSLLAYTLPTLLIPPVAERLILKFQAKVVIPLGMFTIGAGFILMKFGITNEQANWLTILPGSLLAGIGLGLTNTPVTNATTGAVSSSRAGMASGIDMSARLITLAINISLMGFILIKGIYFSLKASLPGTPDTSHLNALAEKIASGQTSSFQQSLPELTVSGLSQIAHGALIQGFNWVLLYGGIGIWILSGISFIIFRSKKE